MNRWQKWFFPMALAAMGFGVAAFSSSHADASPATKMWTWKGGTGPGGVHVSVSSGRGRLGANVLDISEGVRKALGAPADRGVLVNDVVKDSPGDKAGLKAGDVLVAIDGDKVDSAFEIITAMSAKKKGDKVAMDVVRKGKRKKLTATLEDDGIAMWHKNWSHDFDIDVDQWNDMDDMQWVPKQLGKVFPFAKGQNSPDPDTLDDMNKKLDRLQKRLDRLENNKRSTKSKKTTKPQ